MVLFCTGSNGTVKVRSILTLKVCGLVHSFKTVSTARVCFKTYILFPLDKGKSDPTVSPSELVFAAVNEIALLWYFALWHRVSLLRVCART